MDNRRLEISVNGEYPIQLDSLDYALIEALESNPGLTHSELATNLGISRPTVRSKIHSLLDRNIITTRYLSDFVALGYKTRALILVKVKPSAIKSASEKLASFQNIHYVMLCNGSFNILTWGLFRGPEDMLNFVSEDLGVIPDVMDAEAIMFVREVKLTHTFLATTQSFRPKELSHNSLDKIDVSLIRELQNDSTQTMRQISKKIGISESTASRRVQKMINGGIIRIVTMANPLALGFRGTASMGFKISPDQINNAADILASYRQVNNVTICLGRYDIQAWGVFQVLPDLFDFITDELSRLPGLRDIETVVNLKIVKASHDYLTDDLAEEWDI